MMGSFVHFQHFGFYMLKFILKTIDLSQVFTDSQHLVDFSPVSFQHTQNNEFYTNYYHIRVSGYFVILLGFVNIWVRHFLLVKS